ncbi:hypothetical protein [Nitrososphaera sp. AFS]|uniref:hypothetical protein n=1 Tax=Nitrososphaera sp. AFS TaxID=2301191 RepID=UPI0013923228|nr:hypothetical protein [Nitrososphaera sp. AFS]NAL77961.1 hypothetical protein [Nitrososphaera sp. AFS]
MGFKQVPNFKYQENFLYFKNPETKKELGYEKSDEITVRAMTKLAKIGFTYEFFTAVFYSKQSNTPSA